MRNRKGTTVKDQDPKWIARLMRLAHEAKSWSKNPDGFVGCAIASPDMRQLSLGYNGPPGFYDDKAYVALTKEQRREVTVHAELNALLNSRHGDHRGWMLATTTPPCLDCAKAIVQAGFYLVVIPHLPALQSSWYGSQVLALRLLVESHVRVFVCSDPCGETSRPIVAEEIAGMLP
jgi:dCMP deaminase